MQLKWLNPEQTILSATEGYHTVVVEPGHDLWGTLSQMSGIAAYTPPPEPTPEEILAAERAGMRAWRRAFMAALKLFPSPVEGHAHLRETWRVTLAAESPDSDLAIWGNEVVQFIRDHPDMDTFAPYFGGPVMLDAIFRVAMAIERGDDPTPFLP